MQLRNLVFLRDVFILACTSFGGPQVHLSMFMRRLVTSHRYLTEAEFLEIVALCNVMPGPSSTQTITAIGYKRGGPILALFSLLVWALPASLIITLVVLGFTFFSHLDLSFTKFVAPMAVGFILSGAYTMGKAVITDKLSFFLFLSAAVLGIVFTSPWVYPLIIVSGGVLANFLIKGYNFEPLTGVKVKWYYIAALFGILISVALLTKVTAGHPGALDRSVRLFENNYRFGTLVFGGGNVLVPLMYEQFVLFKQYITTEQFSMGYGLVQALPGPIFTLGTFTYGMSLQPYGIGWQLVGCALGSISIFMPGTILIFFFYPIWQQVKKYPIFKKSVKGSNAASVGLIVSAAILLTKPLLAHTDMLIDYALVMTVTFLVVSFTRIPSPVLVICTILLGFLV